MSSGDISALACACVNDPTNTQVCGVNYRLVQPYKMLQTAIGKVSTDPAYNRTLVSFSPYNALTSSRIIPTFIMHGEGDVLVPYSNSMESVLGTASLGGLIRKITSATTSPNNIVPTTYTTGYKHLIRTYGNANHTWITNNPPVTPQDGLYTLVRGDVLKWVNEHK